LAPPPTDEHEHLYEHTVSDEHLHVHDVGRYDDSWGATTTSENRHPETLRGLPGWVWVARGRSEPRQATRTGRRPGLGRHGEVVGCSF